jgi:hypothetical protein
LAHTDGSPSGETSVRDLWKNPRARPTAIVAVAALVALVVWLVVESVGDDGSSSTTTPAEASGPFALSATGLATLTQAAGQSIYWVGQRQGVKYELSQNTNQTYVRYLPAGVEAGDERQFLTVGTYLVEDAYNVTAGTRSQGAEIVEIPGGGVAAISKDSPTSVYVAFPSVDYQVEIYDPDPAVARRLATSGAVQPVPAPDAVSQARGPVKASAEDLRALAGSLGHPLYWAGPKAGTTYELKVSEDGGVYVRYLPPGMDVGSNKGVLTVVTYPVAHGFAVTKEGGKVKGTLTKKLPGGAVAIHARDNPHNVYVGFPGEDVQVEVYSPSPVEATSLVTRGKIVPVG